jgi:hypothetical protein
MMVDGCRPGVGAVVEGQLVSVIVTAIRPAPPGSVTEWYKSSLNFISACLAISLNRGWAFNYDARAIGTRTKSVKKLGVSGDQ